MKIKVGIVGYGVIGKRIADAVDCQQDMTLVGIADIIADSRLDVAKQKGYPIYCSIDDFATRMDRAGFTVIGDLADLAAQSDIVIDCTPPGVAEKNVPVYEKFSCKFIVQGGEHHSLTNFSYSTLANYSQALNAQKARVVSCNTTGLIRALVPIHQAYGIETAFISLIRSNSEAAGSNRGTSNGAVPDLHRGWSHQGIDVATVVPSLEGKINSLAVDVPMTLSHVQMCYVKLINPPSSHKDIVTLWKDTPRVLCENGRERGIYDTAILMEYYRDLGRLRYDRPELWIWEDTVGLDNKGLTMTMDVHMESITVPENIDCIRAMMNLEENPYRCMFLTDTALNIAKDKKKYEKVN